MLIIEKPGPGRLPSRAAAQLSPRSQAVTIDQTVPPDFLAAWQQLAERYDWHCRHLLQATYDELRRRADQDATPAKKPESGIVSSYWAAVYHAFRQGDNLAGQQLSDTLERIAKTINPPLKLEHQEYVQEVLTRLLERQELEQPGGTLNYAQQMLLTVCRDLHRPMVCEHPWSEQTEISVSLQQTDPSFSRVELNLNDTWKMITEIVYTEFQRKVLYETFFNDRSTRDIAVLLQTTPERVRLARSRALQELRTSAAFVQYLLDCAA